jgi:hypothetical protein
MAQVVSSSVLFVLAGLCEIGGGYLSSGNGSGTEPMGA